MVCHSFCSNNNNLLMTNNKPFAFFFYFLFLYLLFAGASPAAMAGRDDEVNQLLGVLSSREDFVQMAGYGDEKLSTVLISGTLVCDPCTTHGDPRPVSGALVSVSCLSKAKASRSNWVRAETDEFGDFLIDLPSHLHGIPDLEKRCNLKVLSIPKKSQCHPSLITKLSGLKLSSVGNGIRTYTAGNLRLTPKSSNRCRHKREAETVKTY